MEENTQVESTTSKSPAQDGIAKEQPIVETKSEKLTEHDRVKRALIKAKKEVDLEPASDARSPEKKASDDEKKAAGNKEKPADKVDDKSKLKKGGDLLAEGDSKEDTTRDRGKAIPSRNLTKEEKEALDKAPDIIKQAFARREKELGNSANALNSKVGALEKELAATREKVAPILQTAEEQARTVNALLKRAGQETSLKPEEYISKLIEVDKLSRENPLEYIVRFAKGNNVDLKELVTGDPSLAFDKEWNAQQVENARLQAELDYYRQQQEQQVQSQQQQQQQQTIDYVTSIANEYAQNLTAEEAEIFDSVSARIFQKLEAEAGGNPDYERIIRQSFEQALAYIPSAQQRKLEQERQAAASRVGRAASASYSPRAGTGAVQASPTSLQDRIRQNARAMGIIGR